MSGRSRCIGAWLLCLSVIAVDCPLRVATCVAAPFHPGCPLSYEAIKKHHAIDDICPAEGKPNNSDKVKLQNRAKNDFCETASPVRVTLATFTKLQAASDKRQVHFGPNVVPKDRTPLHDLVTTTDSATIGEGSVVRFVGFVHHALYSDTDKGESCNCNQPGNENNDVHIYLVGTAGGSPCTGIVAEMSPHFRPTGWTDDAVNGIAPHPVRVTGTLFFDSVNVPCKGGQAVGTNPPRRSLWEIHPVYSCEVCKNTTLTGCPVGEASVWSPLGH